MGRKNWVLHPEGLFHPKGRIAFWRKKKFIPRIEIPRDKFFTSWRMQFITRDEIKAWRVQTQFFLTIDYENAFHSDLLNESIFASNQSAKTTNSVNFPSKRRNFAEKSNAVPNSSHGKNFPMHQIFYTKVKRFHENFEKLFCFHQKHQKFRQLSLFSITVWNDIFLNVFNSSIDLT